MTRYISVSNEMVQTTWKFECVQVPHLVIINPNLPVAPTYTYTASGAGPTVTSTSTRTCAVTSVNDGRGRTYAITAAASTVIVARQGSAGASTISTPQTVNELNQELERPRWNSLTRFPTALGIEGSAASIEQHLSAAIRRLSPTFNLLSAVTFLPLRKSSCLFRTWQSQNLQIGAKKRYFILSRYSERLIQAFFQAEERQIAEYMHP